MNLATRHSLEMIEIDQCLAVRGRLPWANLTDIDSRIVQGRQSPPLLLSEVDSCDDGQYRSSTSCSLILTCTS